MNRLQSLWWLGLALAVAGALALFLGPSSSAPRSAERLPKDPSPVARPGEPEASAAHASLATPRAQQEAAPGASLRRGLSEAEAVEAHSDPGTAAGTPSPLEAQRELQEFEAFVDNTILEIRREDAEGLRQDLERRRAALDETLQRMQQQLELNAAQSERFRNSIWTRLDLELGYIRRWEQGASPESLGELKAHDRALHLQELASFLSDEQLELYSRKGMRWAR